MTAGSKSSGTPSSGTQSPGAGPARAGSGSASATPGRSAEQEPGSAPPLRVVLVSPRNPLNIGAAARAMSNFGFSDLRLVNPYHVAFQEAKSAMGARPLLKKAREFATLAEAVSDCGLVVGTTSLGHRQLEHPLRRLEAGAKLMRRKLAAAPVALLFGSEKFGLSKEDMSHCHWLLRIPTREGHGSMNLGQAVALCLYELIRNPAAMQNPGGVAPEPKRAATAEELERLSELLGEVLGVAGYVHSGVEDSSSLKIRRLIRRLGLTGKDSEILLGMLRQVRWKLLS